MSEVKQISSTSPLPEIPEFEVHDPAPLFLMSSSSCISMAEETCSCCLESLRSFFVAVGEWIKNYFFVETPVSDLVRVAGFVSYWEAVDSQNRDTMKDAWMSGFFALPDEPRERAIRAFAKDHRFELKSQNTPLLWNNGVLESIRMKPKNPSILQELKSWANEQIPVAANLD